MFKKKVTEAKYFAQSFTASRAANPQTYALSTMLYCLLQ